MANPLTSPAFVKMLQEDLREVEDDARKYNDLNSKKEQIFDVITDSTRAWEEWTSVSALGDIPSFNGRLTTLGSLQVTLLRLNLKSMQLKQLQVGSCLMT